MRPGTEHKTPRYQLQDRKYSFIYCWWCVASQCVSGTGGSSNGHTPAGQGSLTTFVPFSNLDWHQWPSCTSVCVCVCVCVQKCALFCGRGRLLVSPRCWSLIRSISSWLPLPLCHSYIANASSYLLISNTRIFSVSIILIMTTAVHERMKVMLTKKLVRPELVPGRVSLLARLGTDKGGSQNSIGNKISAPFSLFSIQDRKVQTK